MTPATRAAARPDAEREVADASPYQDYVYAYPHKSAYRPLSPRPALADVWAEEDRSALFLYVHVPFCEMRCGFCNLFTQSRPAAELPGAYLTALERQARAVRDAVGHDARYARVAVGGGTPTHLTAAELTRLFDIVDSFTDGLPADVPVAVETSPATATADRLAVLRERGTTRVSIGVQSFVESETRALGRPQRRADVEAALARLRDSGIPVVNVDLIYGVDEQTSSSWRYSLDAALAYEPEELYLYPLYVRPLTGLGRRGARSWDEHRLSLYAEGRDHLLGSGYEQVSMRMFRRVGSAATGEPAYCCQDDGMVGLGSGARSYTRRLHYSFDYAVSSRSVRGIIEDYVATSAGDFAFAEVGVELDDDEQRRRYLLKSLLRVEGLARRDYAVRFGADAVADFPELAGLADAGWLEIADDRVAPTAAGLARSDAIGPAFFSPRVRRAMEEYDLR